MSAGLYEIGTVARELGVAPSTLRTWERRYRLVVPHRGPSGQRLYDREQLRQLRVVIEQLRRGARAGAAHRSATLPSSLEAEHHELEAGPHAPARARAAVDVFAADLDDRRLAFFLRLVASELVTNAVVHGGGREAIDLDLELDEAGATVRVHSRGRRFSLKGLRERRRDSGRGLEIIEALADSWTIDTGPLGTTISAHLTSPS